MSKLTKEEIDLLIDLVSRYRGELQVKPMYITTKKLEPHIKWLSQLQSKLEGVRHTISILERDTKNKNKK